MGVTFIIPEATTVRVPEEALRSLAAFRVWAGGEDVPEKARTDYYKGHVWIDLGRQQLFTHVSVTGEVMGVLHGLARHHRLGHYWGSGVLVTNPAADWSGNPDGTYASYRTMTDGRLKLVPAGNGGFDELEGTPDMVLEVVSDSSEKKDDQVLREAYWEAGIPEYWLVDARGGEVEFDLLQHGPKGYKAARKAGGWAKSAVFGKSFKLTRAADPQGNPEFTLEVR